MTRRGIMVNLVTCVITGQEIPKPWIRLKVVLLIVLSFYIYQMMRKQVQVTLFDRSLLFGSLFLKSVSQNDALTTKSIFRIRECDFLLNFTCFGFIISARIWYNAMICILKLKSWPKQWCPGMTDWVQNQCSGFENVIS